MKKLLISSARLAAILLLILGTGAIRATAQTAFTASLSPSLTSPQPVGAIVTWTASASGSANGNLWYRFRERPAGSWAERADGRSQLVRRFTRDTGYAVIRDYGPLNTLDYTASEHEGVEAA